MTMRAFMLLMTFPALAVSAVAQNPHIAPANAPSRITVADSSEPGTRLVVSGRVLGADNKPVPGASIYVYHTDQKGEYVHGSNAGMDRPRLFGYLRSDSDGRYSFATIRPAPYPNSRIPAHVHFEIAPSGYQSRIYEIMFEGDPLITSQVRAQALAPFGPIVIVEVRTTRGVVQVSHDILVH
jgi:protocatechuate 3,4-dioxygenase, beta subunit